MLPANSRKRASGSRASQRHARTAAADRPPRRQSARPVAGSFEETLARYNDMTTDALLASVPSEGPPHLYDLVRSYPSRRGKGIRAALCLATCAAFGGREQHALNSAVAIELFHNGFLLHDDVQDESLVRRGGATMHRTYGVSIAVNVGNVTHLLGLARIRENRAIIGSERAAHIVAETEQMMRQTVEGQALELAWIRDNVCNLQPLDYLRMCLKKTSWYSFVYPMRVGATIAAGAREVNDFCTFGWYVGAAFQIQDDLLNLTGSFERYRKDICGDLLEGKRTLMLIRLLNVCGRRERSQLLRYLGKPRQDRTTTDVDWLLNLMVRYKTIEFARRSARELAGGALVEALRALRHVPDSPAKRFILEMVMYVVTRDH
jgi:geranylgeranyl diphosphate synthase, type II